MSNFEMIFVGVNFLLTLVHSVYLLSKARIASIEREVLVVKAKLVADAELRISALESAVKQASLAASPFCSSTSLQTQPSVTSSSQPVA